MAFELAKVAFYVVAFFVVYIVVKQLWDLSQKSKKGSSDKKEDPFK